MATVATRAIPRKVAIGGVVRGLEALARRFGTRPWASYFEPAIRSAEEGVVVTSFMYGVNYQKWETEDFIRSNPAARAFYMPDGYLVPVGQRWKMPEFARHLRRVAADGADYMYTGEWAKKFVAEATKRGGRVSVEDLAEYQPKWDEPVRFTYRGYEGYGSPAPDTGGLVVGYNLNVLENFDLKSMGHYARSADTLEVMARAFARVSDETRWAINDPLNFQIPQDLWLSKDTARLAPSSCGIRRRRCRYPRASNRRSNMPTVRSRLPSASPSMATSGATTTSSSTAKATGSACCTRDMAERPVSSSMAWRRPAAPPGHRRWGQAAAWCCRSPR